MSYIKIPLTLAVLLLAGCGSEETVTDPIKIKDLVKETNFSTGFPVLIADTDDNRSFEQKGLVRFDTTAQIPLYFVSANGNNPPQKIIDAVTKIEARLGDIFTDFTNISANLSVFRDANQSDLNVENQSYNHDYFTEEHGIENGGLIISIDTAYSTTDNGMNPKRMCGTSSSRPYSGSSVITIDTNTHTFTQDNLQWVSLGNNHGCKWGTTMVIHEMAHAMGMFNHLDKYYESWSDTAMNILATMYNNAPGTSYQDLTPDIK